MVGLGLVLLTKVVGLGLVLLSFFFVLHKGGGSVVGVIGFVVLFNEIEWFVVLGGDVIL